MSALPFFNPGCVPVPLLMKLDLFPLLPLAGTDGAGCEGWRSGLFDAGGKGALHSYLRAHVALKKSYEHLLSIQMLQ
jgi:hypothetical protein